MQGTRGELRCRKVRRTLQAFLDGELDPLQAELVAAHLRDCWRCRIESETITRVIAAIRQVRPDIDLGAYNRLLDVLERLSEHDDRRQGE